MASNFKDRSAWNSSLPHDIILHILSMLPAKSLGRFRCVSKLWLASIRDPNFIKSHLHRAINGDCVNLFLASEPCSVRNQPPHNRHTRFYSLQGNTFNKLVEIQNPFGLSSHPEAEEFDLSYFPRVLGTCNGLICLGRRNELCLLNPCSREYRIVRFDKVFSCGCGGHGLGYDQVNEDYKLVELVNRRKPDGSYDSVVNIYSLNDTKYSTILNVPYCCYSGDNCGIYLSGCVHWVADTGHQGDKIISVDVRENGIREILAPVDVHKDAKMVLGVLRGKLSVLSKFYKTDIMIWALENYGASESWIKLFSIERTILHIDLPSKPLCFVDSGNFLLKHGIKPILYDLDRKIVRDVSFGRISWVYMCTLMTHVASVVPLNSSTYLSTIS